MLYTVKEVAKLTGVTIKALHHYHKIGLLEPCEITDAGYRLYGTKELEILQQILFYRELDFSLENIKKALEDEPSRLICLTKQQDLLFARKQRLDCLLKTINESIVLSKEGEIMNTTDMFKGFSKDQWKDALSGQNEYIKDKYGYDLPEVQEVDVPKMNEQAIEAQQFIVSMSESLKSGLKANDEKVQELLKNHISFLKNHGHNIDAKALAAQSKFFLEDDFHRNMLEGQQVGLAYYLCIATDMHAASK